MLTLRRFTTRRQLMGASGMLIAMAALATATSVARAAKADKRDFAYQDRPKDGKSCSNCRLYTVNAQGLGSCAIVEGDVLASGWCAAYSPKMLPQLAEHGKQFNGHGTARED